MSEIRGGPPKLIPDALITRPDSESSESTENLPPRERENKLPILYVDDDRGFEMVVTIAARGAGCQIELANDAKTAAEKIAGGQYAAVITDGLEGKWTEVAQAAQTKNIPIILCTLAPDDHEARAKDLNVPIIDKGGNLMVDLTTELKKRLNG